MDLVQVELAAAALLNSPASATCPQVLQAYMTNVQLTAAMKDFVERCGNIARMETIGYSVNGYPLNVLEISDKPGVDEPEPSFKVGAGRAGAQGGSGSAGCRRTRVPQRWRFPLPGPQPLPLPPPLPPCPPRST